MNGMTHRNIVIVPQINCNAQANADAPAKQIAAIRMVFWRLFMPIRNRAL
jgi:hypothetical protein